MFSHSKSTVAIIQQRISNLINKNLIKYEFQTTQTQLEYLPANFEEEDSQLERGIKLLQNGAMTLGEFINRFCEQYQITMQEEDEYYNCRFMNNQSLDRILYGDNEPTSSEEKLEDIINTLETGLDEIQ